MHPRRRGPELLALIAAVSCAQGAAAPVSRRLVAVPEDALRSGWARARIEAATQGMFRALTEDGLEALRRGRVREPEQATFLDERGRARAAACVLGLSPRAAERRWAALRRLRGDAVIGWCARGVRVHDAGGVEGFAQRALSVERLLVVSQGRDGVWGFWVEGLVLDDATWRWLPWIPWADAVEAPRGAHTDIAMWNCDLDRPPR